MRTILEILGFIEPRTEVPAKRLELVTLDRHQRQVARILGGRHYFGTRA